MSIGTARAAADFPAADAGFHNDAETRAQIDAVVAAHPAIASRTTIGTSYEGRELWAVKLSDNVAVDEGEPEVLLVAGQHAREHLTVEMALYLIDELTSQLRDRRADQGHPRLARDLDRAERQPGRQRVRHRHRPLPGLAQEPPAERGLGVRRHRPQPQLGLPLGLLRRVERLLLGRDATAARPPSRPRRRRHCATSSSAASSAASSSCAPRSTSTPSRSSCCGPSATPAPT